MEHLKRLALALATTTAIAALCAGSASAVPTITPSGSGTFASASFKVTYVFMGTSVFTIICTKDSFQSSFNGTTSASFGLLTLANCAGSLPCAPTFIIGPIGSLTATTNLGSGTYVFGVTLPSINIGLSGCIAGCSATLSQSLTDTTNTWTNATKTLVLSDDTLTWTGKGCLFYTGGPATIAATFTQTTTPAMVVTGS